MNTKHLLASIERHVAELYKTHTRAYLLYHNFNHTQQVVKHAKEIAIHYLLDENNSFILLTAAWFHDTGHLLGDIATHEESGVKIMRSFLNGIDVEGNVQDDIARCILATKISVEPVTLVEKILCDADTYHLGTPGFRDIDALVWQEMELREGITIDNHLPHSLHFLQTHRYYTVYCRQLLDEGKKQNIERLKAEIAGLQS